MKVISANIGKPTRILWQGRTEETGIYKSPVSHPIFLGQHNVDGDTVTDRKHHGGEFKACYLFASDHYGYWKERYPKLQWDWGMFGENITISGLDERTLIIGSEYQIGLARVQITIPREPCYKLGVRFGDQKIIEEFIHHGHPGTYVRILEQGEVSPGDHLTLIKEVKNSLSIADLYTLLYAGEKNMSHLNIAMNCEYLPPRTREKLSRYQKKGA